MTDGLLEAAGGVGLFLLGMFVMTEGLKQLAGRSLRSLLRRFTRSPTSGALAGAATTAVVQSSSATTVAAVGFVGAGLITFAEALGIIVGANVGTTVTGWLVALFGFKLPLGTLAFPLVLAGSLLRAFGNGRRAALGQALAGFGVIFIGIDLLQVGLGGLEGTVTPDSFPPNTVFGRVQLVGIGVLITLVTQSSSAGVAMALASVNAGTISFPQAAAIVIGMDIGTTVTAAVATVGGGTQVRRTGLAHVIYNCLTGVGAFILLTPYVAVVERWFPDAATAQPEILLVAFHTLFNALGVLAVLPVAAQFGRLVERMVPAPLDDPTHRLGRALLTDPEAALDTVEQTLRDITRRAFSLTASMWWGGVDAARDEIGPLEAAVDETRSFAVQIEVERLPPVVRSRHAAVVHVIDHLGRLLARLAVTERMEMASHDVELSVCGRPLIEVTDASVTWLDDAGPPVGHAADRVADQLIANVRPYRAAIIDRAVTRAGSDGATSIELRLDAVRWLARMAVHVARIDHYLEQMAEPDRVAAPTVDEEPDV